jgi:hypothetical protein
MRTFDEETVSEERIDLDRVIVDPDYRRQVLARLRSQSAPRPSETPPFDA